MRLVSFGKPLCDLSILYSSEAVLMLLYKVSPLKVRHRLHVVSALNYTPNAVAFVSSWELMIAAYFTPVHSKPFYA